jgi:pimeloyl-ACP methyl ester carboxylesterase
MDQRAIENFRAAERKLWDHYGVAPVERFVTLPGLKVHVRVQEVGQGQPVLFVHGSPNAGSKWAPLVAKLGGFRCLVLDRPGCGLSDPVDYSRLDLREFGAALLSQTLDALELKKAAVVASSFGGALTFYFAQAHPERLTRLVQEGCPALVEGFRLPTYHLVWSVLGLVLGRGPSSDAAFRYMGHTTRMARGGFESEVLTWRDALLKWTDTTRHENALNQHLSSRMGKYRYGADFLRQIEMPTLYLWGESDPFGGAEVARRTAAAQPNATLKLFPESGHLPWLDDSAAHAQAIRNFLA